MVGEGEKDDAEMGKHHSEEEILQVLREAEAGEPGVEICRNHGISRSCLGLWKKKYAGLQSNELRELHQLREENSRLRDLVTSLSLERKNLMEILAKKL
jgi:putative transposase